MALPPMVLAGEPEVEHTFYDYDAAGRVARSRTVRHTWGELDVVLVRLLAEWEGQQAADRCPGCGGSKAEHYGKTADDYRAGFDTCPALERLTRSQDAYQKSEAYQERKSLGEHPDQVDRWFSHSKGEVNDPAGNQHSD